MALAGYELPLLIVSIFWLLVGAALPLVIPKGPNRGVIIVFIELLAIFECECVNRNSAIWLIQMMIILTAVCCYTFWLVVFLAQLNPLFGPQLENSTIFIMMKEWK